MQSAFLALLIILKIRNVDGLGYPHWGCFSPTEFISVYKW